MPVPVNLSVSDITATSVRLNWVSWTPLQLFLLGQSGVWCDPSDLPTLFQNEAGTVPVTASGDPIGLSKDKSGNNINVSQSVSSRRPKYLVGAGGVKSIAPDGVDDFLRSSDFGLSQPCTIVTAFIPIIPITGNNIFIFDGLSVNSGSLALVNSGNPVRAYAGSSLFSSQSPAMDQWNIATVVFNGADSVIRLNGVEVQGDAGAGDMRGLTLFAHGGVGFFKPQNNGGIIVRNDRMSSVEISNAENYLASIVGVTL